jgi:hypothetical protein
MIDVLIIALIAVLIIHMVIEDHQRKTTIDYLFTIYNELVFVKTETKTIAKKIEEINRKIVKD